MEADLGLSVMLWDGHSSMKVRIEQLGMISAVTVVTSTIGSYSSKSLRRLHLPTLGILNCQRAINNWMQT